MKVLLLPMLLLATALSFAQDTDFYNLYFEGNSLLAKGQPDKAIEKYTAAIKSFSADYVYFNRGNAYFKKNDAQGALADYSKAITMNPDYAEAYYQRGIVKVAMKDGSYCEDFKKADKLKLDGAKAVFKKYCR